MPYGKTADLVDLVNMMQANREGVSLEDIRREFSVSRRTAERMRDSVVTMFPQAKERVVEKNVKRWYIPQGAVRDFIQFNAEDVSLLESLKRMLNKKGMEDKAETLDRLTTKIKALVKPEVMRRLEPDVEALMEAEGFICRPGPKLPVDTGMISEIRQAILENHQIQITYVGRTSKKTSRLKLIPYGLLYGERKHYLVAKHAEKGADDQPHTFILSNIKDVKILNVPYDQGDFDLQKYADDAFGAFHEPPFDVEWLFDAEVADDADKYVFHPQQQKTKNADGSLTVAFRAGGRREMDWHLYTWGNHVKVIKPENWEEMKQTP